MKFEKPVYTIVDTSSPSISIASEYFETYITELFAKASGSSYKIEQGEVLSKCDYEYPNLYFMVGDYWLEVRPSEYVLDVSKENNNSVCLLAINKNLEPFNIYGIPLLQEYYSIFDKNNGKIGFAPHSVSLKD